MERDTMEGPMPQDFLAALEGKLHFDIPQLAFCTHYSWFGVMKGNTVGIEQLYLFYNRVARLLSPELLTFTIEGPDGENSTQKKRQDLPLSIEEVGDYGFSGIISFAAPDVVCYHTWLSPESSASGIRASLSIPKTEPALKRIATYDSVTRTLKIEALMPRTDKRDPDNEHPLTFIMTVPDAFELRGITAGGRDAGEIGIETDGDLVFEFYAPADRFDMAEQTFAIGIGEGPSANDIEPAMARVGLLDSGVTAASSLAWLSEALAKFTFEDISEEFHVPYAKSAYQIISNTKAPRGRIKGHGVYPSRGTYSAHYLWDACFTDLGVSQFNRRLAEEYLLILAENQEEDGKIPQFVCATWNRPDESQPPLIGWAAWRLYELYGSKELLRTIYRPLSRMVDWWFSYRDEDKDGLVEYQHRLESGWDNSPRFEKGRIAAVDLNSFLNQEMTILSKIAGVLGAVQEKVEWDKRASEHASKMMNRLFDREQGIFYDRLVEEDCLWKVMTPASFMPLWVGIGVPENIAREMIVKYLINPRYFYGARPFPVVAYNDPHYEPDAWWRGPVWPNIAWIMTEILRDYGFMKEYKESISRLINMMVQNDEMNELYSSSTGKPLGAFGLCWTCAIFMDMVQTTSSS